MNRHLVVFFITLSSFSSLFAQTKVEEKINSKYLNDTIHLTIWLPDNWNAQQKYTTIYTFSYGASDAKFIAEQISYLNKFHISNLPPTIVVNIWADMDLIGYNYETGQLTERGNHTISSIRSEIIPLLEQKYKAAKFRTYIGQSYGASYGNYLFLHQPDIFSGYILMSPERIAPSQPPFNITSKLETFYSNRPTYYFVASGALDMQRRQDYAKEIEEKISKLDRSKFVYRYENLPNAGHNNSLSVGLPIALDFVYQHYSAIPQPDSAESILSVIKKYENKLSDLYGIGVDKNSFNTYNSILPVIWQKQDTFGLISAINYFVTNASDIRTLRDFAFSCSIVGLKNRARKLYNEAIKKGLAQQNTDNFYPGYLITCYRENAEIAINKDEGWNLLQNALKICLKYKTNIYNNYYPNIYYYLGKFSAENNLNIQEGIKYLRLYIEKRGNEIILNQMPLDKAYYYLGKCYILNKDKQNGKLYLQKAIEVNSNNKNANDLLQTLR